MLSRASGKQGWVLKKGLNHAKSRIRDAWNRWVLQQGLNYGKSPIREAAAQAHAESPPRPKTYSWTAVFRAPCVFRRRQMRRPRFDLRTQRTGNQRCVTLGLLSVRKIIMPQKMLCSHAASTCAQRHVPAKGLLRSRAAR